MVHSSSTDVKCSHKACAHGMCLNHDPEWKNIGEKRLEPADPGVLGKIFGFKKRLTWWYALRYALLNNYWLNHFECCGEPMLLMKQIQGRKCKKCGREENESNGLRPVALCECCGRSFGVTTNKYG